MNARKIIGSILSVGGIVVSGALLKRGLSRKTFEAVTEAVVERNFVKYRFQN